MVKVVPVVCCSVCCLLLIFTVVALPLSFKSLEQGRYALQLNWVSQQIAEEVTVDPGMYMLGLGNMFVEYPSTFQNMYFISNAQGISGSEEDIKRPPVRARSRDGLEMRISVSFQWKLEPSALKPLYAILGGGTKEESLWRDEFVRFARASLVEACTNFTADSYFTNRTMITDHMKELVQNAFNRPEKGLQMSIKGLQLREVDLPAAFDAEIVRTQEQMQEVEVAMAERREQIIAMGRDLDIMSETVQRRITEMEGDAGKIALENWAEVNQSIIFQSKSAVANAAVIGSLNYSDKDAAFKKLLNIMEIRAVKDHPASHVVFDVA